MKLLIYVYMYYAELKKNAHVSIYSLADLNIGHWVEMTGVLVTPIKSERFEGVYWKHWWNFGGFDETLMMYLGSSCIYLWFHGVVVITSA